MNNINLLFLASHVLRYIYNWYQIAQNITYSASVAVIRPGDEPQNPSKKRNNKKKEHLQRLYKGAYNGISALAFSLVQIQYKPSFLLVLTPTQTIFLTCFKPKIGNLR